MRNINQLAKKRPLTPAMKEKIENASAKRAKLISELSKPGGHNSEEVIKHALPANDWTGGTGLTKSQYNKWKNQQ